MQNLGLLITDRIGLKRCRGLHRGQAEELHHVVRNHVPQCAGSIEVSAALFHADGFSIRDLHMIDVTPVPDGLEDGIVEPKHHNILYGFFPQVVIDTVNLILLHYSFDLAVQRLGRFQIVAERLLDHNAPPPPVLLVRQTGGSQLLDNLAKKLRRGRQIKHVIARGMEFLIQIAESASDSRVGIGICKLPALVVEALREPLRCFSSAIPRGQKSCYLGTKLF